MHSVDLAPRAQVDPNSSTVSNRRPRFSAPLVILGLFWSFVVAVEWIEMSMSTRFISRWIAYGLLLVTVLLWWFADRGIQRRLRWFALGVVVPGAIVASLVADPTVAGFPLVMSGCPFLLTGWAGWIWASQNFSPRAVRIGLCAVVVAVWGFFDLVRWEGLDGGQHTRLAWRWSPTAEARFLTTHADTATESSVNIATPAALSVQPGDWPRFRGPNGDSRVEGANIGTDWQSHPPTLMWRKRVGPAWSSLCIVNGRLFTHEQRGEDEAVVCYDSATGDELWVHHDRERFDEALSGPGPRATPTFADGRLYALGAIGRLNCLDAATGHLVWTHNAAADAEAPTPQWGFSSSPLVLNDLAVVFVGGEARGALAAYRAQTGELHWTAAAGTTSFSSPQSMAPLGMSEIVMITDAGLAAFDPTDGRRHWHYSAGPSGLAVAIAQPQRISDAAMLIPSGAGVALVELVSGNDGASVQARWTSNDLKPSLNDFVASEQTIFGFDDGIFCAVDVESGKRLWKKGRYGHGQVLLFVDQKRLLVVGENGEVVLLAANPKRHEELGRFQAIEGKTWNHPAFAQNRLFVRNAEEMACYELADQATLEPD